MEHGAATAPTWPRPEAEGEVEIGLACCLFFLTDQSTGSGSDRDDDDSPPPVCDVTSRSTVANVAASLDSPPPSFTPPRVIQSLYRMLAKLMLQLPSPDMH